MRLWFAPSASCRNWTPRERAAICNFHNATVANSSVDADVVVHIEKEAYLGHTARFSKRHVRPWHVYVSLESYIGLGASAIEL